jgi:hypothetical protein
MTILFNSFDQSPVDRDRARQSAALAAIMSHSSEPRVGLRWREHCRVGSGGPETAPAVAHSSIDFVMKLGGNWLVFECKALPSYVQTARRRMVQGVVPSDAHERTPLETTYRVVLSLMEREQITLARKALDALPLGRLDHPMIFRLRKMLAVPTTKTSQKRDIDRAQDYQWIRNYAQDYRGKWVALDNGRLLATASSLRELLDCVKALHLESPPLVHQISQ